MVDKLSRPGWSQCNKSDLFFMTKWKEDKKRKNKVRKDAKYDKVSVVPIIRSLVGLGFTEVDIGTVLGVSPTTIHSWKQRYPGIYEANKEGKQILKGLICAQMIRCATGYEYEETDITYKDTVLGGSKSTPENIEKIVVHKKFQPGNTDLLKFLANNLMGDVFPRTPTESQTNILQIIGSVEPERIKQFAGKLAELCSNTKQVESKEVDESGQSSNT